MQKLQLLFVFISAAWINIPIYAAYELVWEDTFNSVNTTVWTCEIGNGNWGWGNGESQYYTAREENIKAENGNLVITAQKENYANFKYTSARIKTLGKVSCKYGMIEARIKCPWGAMGVWPAFWMMGEDITSKGWPRCGEIDIMEQMCTSNPVTWNTTLATYHWNNNGLNGNYSPVNYGLSKNVGEQLGNAFRIYGVEWTPNALIGYVKDGNGENRINIVTMDIGDATNESNGRFAFHKEHFLLLNIALGGTYTGHSIDPDFASATMLVDWVRIYQDKETYPQSKLTNNSNLSGGGQTDRDYWVVYKDDLSGMSSCLDLRNNPPAIWESTLSDAPVNSTKEGENALSYTVNAAIGSWFGFGMLNKIFLDFSSLSDYRIHFAYNTTYRGQMAVKLGGTNGEFSVDFDAIADGNWHTCQIPMSSFIAKGMILGTSANNLLFSVVCENVVSTGSSLMIDDVYYCKSGINPVIEIKKYPEEFIAYPTFVVDNIMVKSSRNTFAFVYDILGKLKAQTPVQEGENTINLNFLSDGMYILKLKNSQFTDGVLFIKQSLLVN